MTHLRCTPCRLRFDSRRIPDIETCPTCDGVLEPLGPTEALGLSLFRGIPMDADGGVPAAGDDVAPPAWTTALAVALERRPPTAP